MTRNTICVSFVILVALLSGCATSSPIQRASDSRSKFRDPPELIANDYPKKDIYRIFHQASTGFVSIASIRQAAMQRAEQFAKSQGKSVVVLGERISQPPYILGNFPRIEIVFALAAVVEPVPSVDRRDDKYDQIERLKKLLDDGAITRDEYESEKAKVLK